MKTKWTYEKYGKRYLADIDGCATRVFKSWINQRWNLHIYGGEWLYQRWGFRTMAEAKRHAEAMVAHMKGVKR